MFMHAVRWAATDGKDKIYYNLNFDPSLYSHDNQTKIFCLHGTADRVAAFEFLAEGMINNLPNNISSIHVVAFDGRCQGKGIEYFAEQLIWKIKIANDKSKNNDDDIDNVILIGHSRGGLIAAYFAEYFAKPLKINVRAIFTIGAPFGGSVLAIWPLTWVSTSVYQMQIDSKFLKALVKKIQQSETQYYHIAARNDAIVSLNSTYSKKNNPPIVFNNQGHLSLMSSAELLNYINNQIIRIMNKSECISHYKMPEDEMLSILNEMIFIHSEEDLSLVNLCIDIESYMNELKTRMHLLPATAKIEVLKELLKALEEMSLVNENEDGQSIGDFIESFLQEKSVNHHQKRMDILNASLNYPLTFFQHTETISKNFIENLIAKYRNVPFPSQRILQSKNSSSYSI